MNPVAFLIGLILVGMGAIFLGVNYGWWSTGIWSQLMALWPALLIILGLRFLIRNNAVFLVLSVGTLILVTVLASTTSRFPTVDHMNNQWPHWLSGEESTLDQSQPAVPGDTFMADLSGHYNIAIQGADVTTVAVNLKGPKEFIDALSFEKQDTSLILREDRTMNRSLFHWNGEEISGTITVPRFVGLNLTVSGLGDITIRDYTGNFSYEGSGASQVDFQNSSIDNPTIELSGAGRVRLDQCRGQGNFQISGAAEVTAKRCELQNLKVDASGGAKVAIQEGGIVNADIKTSGAANIKIPRPSGDNKQSTSGASRIDYTE